MTTDNISADQILQAAGKPLRNTCRILIHLEQHEGQTFTVDQLAHALPLTNQQVRSAAARLATKRKVKRVGGGTGVAAVYTSNPEYEGSKRPAQVRSQTPAARLHSKGKVPVGFLSFAKYLDQKLTALDHAILHCESVSDKDMLIRMRNEYGSLRIAGAA